MAIELSINRDYRDPTCTLGVISNGAKSLQTMERPWIPSPDSVAGLKGHSCIAPGRYRLEKHSSDAHPNVWALVNAMLDVYHFEDDVPAHRKGKARTCCLLHPANYAEELEGCIAPGVERYKYTRTRWMVTSSRDGINQVRTWIGNNLDAWITISEEKLKV